MGQWSNGTIAISSWCTTDPGRRAEQGGKLQEPRAGAPPFWCPRASNEEEARLVGASGDLALLMRQHGVICTSRRRPCGGKGTRLHGTLMSGERAAHRSSGISLGRRSTGGALLRRLSAPAVVCDGWMDGGHRTHRA